MIYLFTGDNSIAIKQESERWKQHFISKYWEFNVVHLKANNDIDTLTLNDTLLGQSFLSEKRLVILEGIPRKSEDGNSMNIVEEFIETKLDLIPEENIILFIWYNPDKRGSLYKKLVEKAETKIFNGGKDAEWIYQYLSKKYPHLDRQKIESIVKLKWNNLEKSVQEIEKLLIYKEDFSLKDVQNNIFWEFEDSLFELIDLILQKRSTHFLNNIRNIQFQNNFYLFYNSLLANLRTSIYICLLKKEKRSEREIDTLLNLWNKKFLIQKSFSLSFEKLKNLYKELINFDTSMKTGNTLWTNDDEFYKEIEFICIKYMNT